MGCTEWYDFNVPFHSVLVQLLLLMKESPQNEVKEFSIRSIEDIVHILKETIQLHIDIDSLQYQVSVYVRITLLQIRSIRAVEIMSSSATCLLRLLGEFPPFNSTKTLLKAPLPIQSPI